MPPTSWAEQAAAAAGAANNPSIIKHFTTLLSTQPLTPPAHIPRAGKRPQQHVKAVCAAAFGRPCTPEDEKAINAIIAYIPSTQPAR